MTFDGGLDNHVTIPTAILHPPPELPLTTTASNPPPTLKYSLQHPGHQSIIWHHHRSTAMEQRRTRSMSMGMMSVKDVEGTATPLGNV